MALTVPSPDKGGWHQKGHLAIKTFVICNYISTSLGSCVSDTFLGIKGRKRKKERKIGFEWWKYRTTYPSGNRKKVWKNVLTPSISSCKINDSPNRKNALCRFLSGGQRVFHAKNSDIQIRFVTIFFPHCSSKYMCANVSLAKIFTQSTLHWGIPHGFLPWKCLATLQSTL